MELLLFNFTDYSSLLLYFFLNGAVITCLLVWQWYKTKRGDAVWLATLMVLCMLYIAPFMLGYAGWYSREFYRNLLFYLPLQQLFLLGPIILMYTRSLIQQSFRLRSRTIIHFVPAIMYNLYIFIVFINDKVLNTGYFFYADGRDMDLDAWYQIVGLISMVGYLALSIREYLNYKKFVFEVFSFAEELTLRWFQVFLNSFLLILLLRVLFFILNPEWGEFGSKFWYYFCFSILFNFIGFKGYIHAVKYQLSREITADEEDYEPMLEMDWSKNNGDNKIVENTEQEEADLANWKEKFEQLMEIEELYKNPKLSIADLAAHFDTHAKFISGIINMGFDLNFNDWVNQYRTEEVKRKIKSGESSHKTLLGLAFDAGFNSKSTFNRAFKKQVGITPNQYVKNVAQERDSNHDMKRQ
jgi:AraC-like DNA-binding protein